MYVLTIPTTRAHQQSPFFWQAVMISSDSDAIVFHGSHSFTLYYSRLHHHSSYSDLRTTSFINGAHLQMDDLAPFPPLAQLSAFQSGLTLMIFLYSFFQNPFCLSNVFEMSIPLCYFDLVFVLTIVTGSCAVHSQLYTSTSSQTLVGT